MKVKCIINTPDSIKIDNLKNFNLGLILGKEYLIMGMTVSNEHIWYLIDEQTKPNFYPSVLFDVVENTISEEWFFRLIDASSDDTAPFGKTAMWGYEELILDSLHYENLLMRKSEALHKYFEVKVKFESLTNL